MNIETIEKCLNSNFTKYPRRKDIILNLINEDHNLEGLTLFDDILDKLLEFVCQYKGLINQNGLAHILELQDINHPVLDDDLSYEKTKHMIIDECTELELSLYNFPEMFEDLKLLQSAKEYGSDTGSTNYLYSLEELKNIATNNKKH
jgi:hypothetical protein